MFLLAAGSIFAYIKIESRALEPILPLTLFQNRIISFSVAGSFTVGMVLIGVSSYVLLFIQGVSGGTAVNAGAALAPVLTDPLERHLIPPEQIVSLKAALVAAIHGSFWLVLAARQLGWHMFVFFPPDLRENKTP